MRILGRNERLFREAMRRFTQEIDAIFARHAAAGHLKSGGTIKALVRAMDDTTAAVVNDGLNGIAAVTDYAGRKRKRLIEEFTKSLDGHHKSAVAVIRIALERIDLESDFPQAGPMIEMAKRRHHERIADFAEGWTAPIAKPWKDRHPLTFALLVAAAGAALGATATKLADQLAQSNSSPSRQ
jgi:hypothetical protein